MDRWNWFSLYSPKGRPAVWREVTLAGLSTSSCAACDVPQTPQQSSAEMSSQTPWTCLGRCCLGLGQEHTAARILLAQLQASVLRSSQSCSWLWSKWLRLYLCFERPLAAALAKNTLLCCGLDCIYITRACENQEEAVDVRVLNRPRAAALWHDMQAFVPYTSQQWKGFSFQSRGCAAHGPGQRCLLQSEEASEDEAGVQTLGRRGQCHAVGHISGRGSAAVSKFSPWGFLQPLLHPRGSPSSSHQPTALNASPS